MTSTNNSYLTFTFSNPRQRWIYDQLLALLGRGSAAFYRDACWLMSQDPKIETAVHVVGHLFRELECQLRSLVVDQSAVEARLQEKMSQGSKCGNSQFENLKRTHQEEINIILTQWAIASDHPVAKLWRKRIKKDPLHKFAHHRILGRARSSAAEFEKIIEEWEAVFRFILKNTQTNYIEYHSRLDELLSKEIPTREDLQVLRESVPNSLHAMTYFFGRLPYPQWMQPLRGKGYFEGPPDPERDPEKTSPLFPYWPQTRYLIRMASVRPEEVMDIILGIQDKGNRRVQLDLIEAAKQMPGSTAAKMVPKVLAWLEAPRYRGLTQDCADLVSDLATNGQVEPAIDLATKLFAVGPFKTASGWLARDLIWDYGKSLDQCMPFLVKVSGMAVFRMLCDLLVDARRGEYGERSQYREDDLSHLDRPRLEAEPRKGGGSLDDALISVIRDSAIRLATEDVTAIPSLVRELQSRKWAIFHRLALYLLAHFAQNVPQIALTHVREFHRYDSDCYHNEYYSLARAAFPLAGAVDRGRLLTSIWAGPNRADIRERFVASGKEATDRAVADAADEWRRDRLGELKPVLNAPWRRRLTELEERLGPAQSLITLDRIAIREHPAPEEAQKFAEMNVQEIIAFLVQWRPNKKFPGQSPDPIFTGLQKAVASEPIKFAEEAQLFQQVDVSYIRHFLEGLEHALKQAISFPWAPVIELCRWITRQGLSNPAHCIGDFGWDRDWGYTRKALMRLIRAGFKSASNRIPVELRTEIWEILHTLSEDPEPSAEQEKERISPGTTAIQMTGGDTVIQSHEHPMTLASGSTRPQAIKAVIDYALWMKHCFSVAGQATPQIDLSSVPEAQQVLERHLSPDVDSSAAVASVFGRRFSDLYDLDPEWAIRNKSQVFPADEALQARRDAAWEAFIISSQPRKAMFDVLEAEYIWAVEALATRVPRWRQSHHYPERLGVHLWNLYLWGTIQLESHEGILGKFCKRADDDSIGKLHWNLGWELHEDTPELTEAQFPLVEAFWEWRLTSLPDQEYGDEHVSECQAYGVWFSSGRFPYDKSIYLLESTYRKTGKVRLEPSVMETLAGLVNEMPEAVLRCGHLIVRRVEEPWQLTLSGDALETILSNTTNHESAAVAKAARELKALLVAKGFTDFAG